MGRLESTVANVACRLATEYHSPTGRWTAWGDGVGLLTERQPNPHSAARSTSLVLQFREKTNQREKSSREGRGKMDAWTAAGFIVEPQLKTRQLGCPRLACMEF